MSSIQQSLADSPTWIHEPTPSLKLDDNGELITTDLDDGPLGSFNSLPTIRSIPEISNSPEEPRSLLPPLEDDLGERVSPKLEIPITQEPVSPSRRSSTTSVKAIFRTSESDIIVIRRSSASARVRVDQGLQDVISRACLTARLYASSREEELFEAPKTIFDGSARSHPGLSMAGMAKKRLTRHESIRVLRRRSLLDRSNIALAKKTIPAESLATRRRLKNLRMTLMSGSDSRTFANRDFEHPSPFSQSSTTVSAPNSAPGSPTQRPALLVTPGITPEVITSFKTSRSFVDNLKGFFSPVSNQFSDGEFYANKTTTPASIRRWAKGPLHRRTRSAPDVPEDPDPLPAPSREVDIRELDVGVPIFISRSSSTIFDHRAMQQPLGNNPKPSRRKSFLSSLRCSSAE